MNNEPRKGGSERARFVKRACTLKDDRTFRRSCEGVAHEWNLAFPEFPVQKDRQMPPDELGLNPDEYLLPIPLLRLRSFAVEEPIRAVRDDVYLLPGDKNPKADQSKVIRAKQVWRGFIGRLCEQFWPRDDFPHWLNCREHPAHHFVAACLVWQPLIVPEDWILQPQLLAHVMPYDPRGAVPGDDGSTARVWRIRYETLIRLMEGIIARDGAILGKEFSRIREAAEQSAGTAGETAPAEEWYPILLAYPGVSTEEIRKGVSLLNETFREQFDIRKRVQVLKAAGESTAEIARRLGIDRKTVYDWLEQNSPDTKCGFSTGKSQRPTG